MQPDSVKPAVTVIMPVYNAGQYVALAIESILAQTFTDFELLISDDGSSDDSRNIVDTYARKDKRIVCFHNQTNIGKTATVNNLFKQSKGDLVTIHDADDISLPERFALQVGAFRTDAELGVCGVSFITMNDRGFIVSHNPMPSSWDDIRRDIFQTSQFHGPTMMLRSTVLIELGQIYRPYFRDNYEDTDLAFRAIEKYKGYNLSEFLYLYRILDSSLCRQNVDVRNRNLYKVVAMLGMQRRDTGVDYLMKDRPEKADEYLESVTAVYRSDPALIHREAAAYYLCWNLFTKAIGAAWRGFLARPGDVRNLRTLLYIIRKTVLKNFENRKTHYKEILV